MDDPNAWRAVAGCYHGFFASLVLRTVAQRGAGDATGLVFRTFRAQRLCRFLSGLSTPGLAERPHAVAAAQYR